MKHNFKKYCKDYENIENYEKALADNFKGWDCHHRLETHTSDGERRPIDITADELIALDMYYNRTYSELIFMKRSEHRTLHHKGKQKSEETRKKMSEAQKNISEETRKKLSEAKKGKHHSEETRKKLSEAHKGKRISEETRNKISEAKKGKHISEEAKMKIGAAKKGMHFFNNGKINIRAKECPPGFVPGRIKKL